MTNGYLRNTPTYSFEIFGIEAVTSVLNFTAVENISSPFETNVSLLSKDEIDAMQVIGKEALLTVSTGLGDRYFHGVISQFVQSGRDGSTKFYQALVVPELWLLSLSQNCRIFQNMKVQEIISKILEENGITSDCYSFRPPRDDLKREYCVQYRETNLEFISRLLAEEGIFYFFEHRKDKHILVFSDTSAAYQSIPGDNAVTFNPPSGLTPGNECILGLNVTSRVRPNLASYRDFNFEKPTHDLTARKKDDSNRQFEIYDYPGNYHQSENGKRLARIRQEELVALRQKAEGKSTSPRFTSGFTFTLTDHDHDRVNREYLFVQVAHSGDQPQAMEEKSGGGSGNNYWNTFVAIPSEVTIRPKKIQKPFVKGVQTATVVGPKGEEIHTDDYGRVKVQFHWDREGQRNDRSSCWIRVAQSWGGGTRGAQYIPRIGDEVLVDFLEGDPDRPIVTGSVYNGDNQPINSLKKSITQSGFRTKTHKGDGFHELRFDDAKGKEEIFLHSQKDMNMVVLDRRGETIGGDSGTVISRNRDVSVGGDSYTVVTGKATEMAKEVVIAADSKITIVSGASSIVITPEGIKINNAQRVDINDGSSASMPEKRPVNGSTGKGGGGGGRKGGSSAEESAGPAAAPLQPPEAAPAKDVAPPADDMQTGAVGNKLSGPGDLVSSGTPSPGGGKPPTMNDLNALKNQALQEGRDRLTGEISQTKAKLLEKTGIADLQDKVGKLSEKPAGLLGDRGIKPDDLKKTF